MEDIMDYEYKVTVVVTADKLEELLNKTTEWDIWKVTDDGNSYTVIFRKSKLLTEDM
jgi:hypothetical protein